MFLRNAVLNYHLLSLVPRAGEIDYARLAPSHPVHIRAEHKGVVQPHSQNPFLLLFRLLLNAEPQSALPFPRADFQPLVFGLAVAH
jgi:hypothetical protein